MGFTIVNPPEIACLGGDASALCLSHSQCPLPPYTVLAARGSVLNNYRAFNTAVHLFYKTERVVLSSSGASPVVKTASKFDTCFTKGSSRFADEKEARQR